jgi:23S rRNA (adenine2503-C2)-methyltransferase
MLGTLLGMTLAEMEELAAAAGEPGYRAQQIFHAVYEQRVAALDEVTTLPAAFRSSLQQRTSLGLPQIQQKFTSSDGTVRYLIAFADGQSVEAVWMPTGDGGEAGDGTSAGEEEAGPEPNWRRSTICVSSQVGCAVDCQFCLTALLGVKRNLTAGEIVGQVVCILRDQQVAPPDQRVNLVFMGMGEPFLNYDAFMKAVRLLAEGVGIPEVRMTVSTAGVVPRIHDLGKEPVRPKLAISLNAGNDELRSRIMPLNRKWNLAALAEAARAFPLRPRERLTFEYVLLAGVNDRTQDAREVLEFVRGMRAKVNLIAWNPGPDVPFETPAAEDVAAFQQLLMAGGVPAFIRRPRGREIFAACGQLKRTVA